VVELVDTQP